MANDPHSILWQGTDPSVPFAPKNDAKKEKPKRYRAGRAPAWALDEIPKEEVQEEDGMRPVANFDKSHGRFVRLRQAMEKDRLPPREERVRHRPIEEEINPVEAAVLDEDDRSVVEAAVLDEQEDPVDRPEFDPAVFHNEAKSDGEENNIDTDVGDAPESVEADQELGEKLPPRECKVEDVTPSVPSTVLLNVDREGEDERQFARKRALIKRKMEEETLQVLKQEDESTEESEEASVESSEESDYDGRMMLKPVFVPRGQRTTDEEKRAREQEEERLAAAKRKQERVRKQDAKVLLAETIRLEEEKKEEKEAVLSEADMPDDEDDNDEEDKEYELWKIRELRRLKRNMIERHIILKEQAEIERRRNMTDAEREEDDKRLDALNPKREKGQKYQFLQKYFHKGAYFMDKAVDGSEDLYNRDFNEALESEKLDRSALPKVMQMRRGYWGMKGNVKHTHLSDADTSEKNSVWVQEAMRLKEKLSGRKPKSDQFHRPSAK